MSGAKERMREDKALRDTARSLVTADVAHVKTIFSGGGLGKRVVGRIGDGATDVLDKATDQANSHRGILAALIGAIALWFARNPILALLDDKPWDDEATNSTGDETDHTAAEQSGTQSTPPAEDGILEETDDQ